MPPRLLLLLAVNDAGAIRYFSRKEAIDTVGVTNLGVVPYLRRYPDRQTGLMEYLAERKPEYVIVLADWHPRIAGRADVLRPVKAVKLRRNTVCGGDTTVVYRPVWQRAAPTRSREATLKWTCTREARSQRPPARPV